MEYSYEIIIPNVMFWWFFLFVLARLMRKTTQNTWEKDLLVSLIQGMMIMILVPVLAHVLK
ncbi:hypothetical protein [Caldalkalibacillus mannanilyticus]|uniref:hypothetical protein n=1 Tax=Caldalkalibacillus mannanilyticus TaxID=1418 RepID=UPI0004682E16|nr:hypothetical protein [Caldalkalibacillus mannanilyticus]